MLHRLRPQFQGAALVVAACFVVAGCVGPLAAAPTPLIGPNDACAGHDPQARGYYPQLEVRLPKNWDGRGPDTLDSGRYCSTGGLGYLATVGISELRYAAATWTAGGGQSSLSMIAYEADGLTTARLADAFQQGAQLAPATEGVSRQAVTVRGRPAVRVDVLTASSRNVRIVWPSTDGSAVNVISASEVTEGALTSAEAAFTT